MLNSNSFEIWISTTSAILGIIGYVTGFFNFVWKKFKGIYSKLNQSAFEIPSKSIVIVRANTQFTQTTTWWHMGKRGDRPAMQVVSKFFVTNITKGNILLTGAELRKPKCRGIAHVDDANSHYHGSYPIQPGHTTKLSVHFWIEPPVRNIGESFIADIAIFDQFGNKHWIKKVEFKYL